MAGDLRRLRGDRGKKSVPHCIVHACMNGLFFLTTELHRSFSSYITFTSLLHHSFSSYVTSILCAICTSPPFLNVLTAGFPAAPARSLSYAINCAPVHRFLLALVQILSHPAWIQAKIARESVRCIVMHRAENLSARFWRVFGEKMGLFMAQATETPWEPLRRCGQQMLW